jgi:hypothetical protein
MKRLSIDDFTPDLQGVIREKFPAGLPKGMRRADVEVLLLASIAGAPRNRRTLEQLGFVVAHGVPELREALDVGRISIWLAFAVAHTDEAFQRDMARAALSLNSGRLKRSWVEFMWARQEVRRRDANGAAG